MPYTYCHISNKTNRIFYIGKGTAYRSTVGTGRSKEWKEISQHGYTVEILAEWNTHQEAGLHEKFLIQCAKEMKWDIVNKYAGGQIGPIGYKSRLGIKNSIESNKKSGLSRTGKKMHVTQKMRDANTGISNPNWQGMWITPEGTFDTCRNAAIHHKIDTRTVRARCKGYKEQLVNSVKMYPPKDGWSFQSKE